MAAFASVRGGFRSFNRHWVQKQGGPCEASQALPPHGTADQLPCSGTSLLPLAIRKKTLLIGDLLSGKQKAVGKQGYKPHKIRQGALRAGKAEYSFALGLE